MISRSRPTKSPSTSSVRMRSRRSGSTPRPSSSVGYSEASPSPTRYVSSPAASSAAHRTVRTSAVPVGRGGADQLDPGLEELARLAALRAHAAVGVREVAEAQRRLGVAVARRDQARDRDRHVRAEHEHLAVLVEHAVRGAARVHVGALERALVLERRRVDLAVAGPLEHLADAVGHRAQLAHLVGQEVSRSAGDAIDHRPGLCQLRLAGGACCVRPRPARRPRARSARRGHAAARRSARIRDRCGGRCRSR